MFTPDNESRDGGKQEDRTYDNPLRFVKRAEVRQLTGWSDPTLWRRIRDGAFPPPDVEDAGLDKWYYKTVMAALENASTQTTGDAA